MAKKKSLLSSNKRIFLFAGVGGIAAVLIGVFVFGIGIPNINPMYQETRGLTTNEIQQNEGVIINVNENVKIASGDGSPNSTCIDLPGQVSCDMTVEPSPPPPIDEILENSTIIEDPPVNNQTDYSDDPPPTQVCDELELGCGSRTLQLTSKVTKTDSSGTVTTEEETFSVGQLSFFVEDISGIDFSSGFVEIELVVDVDSVFAQEFTGTGIMDVLIRGETILSEPILITPVANPDGTIQLKFGNSLSNSFLVSIGDNFNRFLNEQVSRLSFVTTFQIDETGGDSFGVTNLKVFSMDIARDDQKIIIVNEEGIEERVYPSDSRVVLNSIAKSYSGEACTVYACNRACGSCTQTCQGSPSISAACLTAPSSYPAGTAPAPPSFTSIVIVDKDGKLIANGPGGSGTAFFDYNQLTRNANYTMTISDPSMTIILPYGKTQETKSFTCFSEAIVNYALVPYGSYPYVSTGQNKVPSGITITGLNCNFP